MVSVIGDRWCGNKKSVGETSGIWWKNKKEDLISNVDIDDRNICKYENKSGS